MFLTLIQCHATQLWGFCFQKWFSRLFFVFDKMKPSQLYLQSALKQQVLTKVLNMVVQYLITGWHS